MDDVVNGGQAGAPAPAPTPEPAAPPAQTSTAPEPAAAAEPQTAAASEPAAKSEPPAEDSKPEGYIASGPAKNGKVLTLVQDPVSGKRSVQFMPLPQEKPAEDNKPESVPQTEKQEANVTPVSEEAAKAAEAANAEPEKYTLDEFSQAIASGNIDERRVPPEYSQQYADFKIKQAVKAYNDQQKAAAAKQEEVKKQLTPEEQAEVMRDFYKKLDANAKERALADLGLTEEQLDDDEYSDENEAKKKSFNAAYEWHRQQLINDIQRRASQEQAMRQAQQEIYDGIVAFVNDAKTKEPNFNAIDLMMNTRYKELPYGEARPVEEALTALKAGTITADQTETLRKYYESCRKEFYAKKNNLRTVPQQVPKAPPVVERGGDGTQLPPKAPTIDYDALRNAKSVKEKRMWLQNFFSLNKRG